MVYYFRPMKTLTAFTFLLLALVTGCDSTVEEKTNVVEEVNPVSGLSRWHTEDQDFSLELVQLTPDFVRAVYEAKGLPKEVIESVSSYCVFGTIVRNRADVPLSYNIADWRYVTADGKQHLAKAKSEWVSEWREMGIAFRWTLLTEAQTYQVGDWGQGFTTVELPHGTHFDLHYSWTQHDQIHTNIIRGMRCAPAELEN
jgi:hypothetical protein